MLGTISKIHRFEDKKPRYFLFIRCEEDKKSYFLHVSKFKGDWKELIKTIEEKGKAEVEFTPDEPGENGEIRAKEARLQ